MKRILLYCFTARAYLDLSYEEEDDDERESDNDQINNEKNESFSFSSMGTKQLLCISIAGGFSGSMQHIFSHYTENLGLDHAKISVSTMMNSSGIATINNSMKEKNGVKNLDTFQTQGMNRFNSRSRNVFHLLSKKIQAPPMKPLLFIFPMNAIGFIAFEYGKDIVNSSRD